MSRHNSIQTISKPLLGMDHEKPQPVASQVYEYNGGEQHTSLVMSDLSPDNEDTLYGRTPSINEPDNVEEKRERRGESLWLVTLCEI
jgi:amino acid transporter